MAVMAFVVKAPTPAPTWHWDPASKNRLFQRSWSVGRRLAIVPQREWQCQARERSSKPGLKNLGTRSRPVHPRSSPPPRLSLSRSLILPGEKPP